MPLMFSMIGTGDYWVAVIGMSLATVPHSMYYAAMAGIMAKSFPASIRYTGISVAYQVSSTVFAGTTPMVGEYLLQTTGSIVSVIVLSIAYVLVTIVSALLLLRKSAAYGAQYASTDSFHEDSAEKQELSSDGSAGTGALASRERV